MTTALFVSECPLSALKICHWRSEPISTEIAAREALRAHVAEHRHGDLVEFAAAHTIDVVRYERSGDLLGKLKDNPPIVIADGTRGMERGR